MIRKFWWGNQDNTRRMQWVKWSTLCSPKSLGGMGFQDLRQFNDALLGKQVWRLYHEKDTLLYKVFNRNIFQWGVSWMLISTREAPLLGKVFYRLGRLFAREYGGE